MVACDQVHTVLLTTHIPTDIALAFVQVFTLAFIFVVLDVAPFAFYFGLDRPARGPISEAPGRGDQTLFALAYKSSPTWPTE